MKLPSRIGRYHVLGRIAYGGMAEILLAKLLGPGGFERPVVIKRVLPHMAAEREFRDMFLDEARIVAAIHHPNVVQVHELGREDDELYLVMEYLAGESARSLSARAAARGVHLNLGLCAHIVAEACAGLHAAHEFTGPDGKLLQVVHRDVCPNNLIVTYEGSVKVVDFGIALAADRFTMTDAGQVKGKAAYMAPEQCMGKPIDRRTDVFALGVVLYELSTGHRLFGDALEARVVACLRNEEVPPPSRVVRGYPKELERICMRALRTAPEERFASAEEMRRELVRFQRSRATELLPEQQIRQCMHDLFEDRIAEKAEMLCQLREGSGTFHIPSAEISDELTAPLVQTEGLTPGALDVITEDGRDDATRVPARRKQRARRRILLWSVLTSVPACLVAAATMLAAEPARGARHALPSRLAPELLGSAHAASIPHGVTPKPTTVHVDMASQPAGAEVWIDDIRRGVTPLSLELPRSDRPSSLRLVLSEHETLEQTLPADDNQSLLLVLTPIERSEPSALHAAARSQPSAEDARDDVPPHSEAEEPPRREARAADAEERHAREARAPGSNKAVSTDAADGPARDVPEGDERAKRKRTDRRADGEQRDDFFLFD